MAQRPQRALNRVITPTFHSLTAPSKGKRDKGGGKTRTSRRIAQLRAANQQQPIASLPLELLSFIFELACLNVAACPDSVSRSVSNLRRTRLAIGSTCFLWREVALSTPVLWHAIAIMNDCDVRRLIDLEEFSMYTQRAKARKLGAFLFYSSEEIDWENVRSRLLCRCETIMLMDIPVHLQSQIFAMPLHWPDLRVFGFVWESWLGDDMDMGPHVIDLTNAHFLNSLWVEYHSSWPVYITLRGPSTSSITKLCLRGQGVDPESTVSLLRSSPGLEVLQWSYSYTYEADTHAELKETVRLLRLRELHIDGDTAIMLMTKLDAPKLERLRTSLVTARDHGSPPFSDPSQFPRLRSLDVNDIPGCRNSPSIPYLAAFLRSHGDLQLLHLPLAYEVLSEVLDSLSLLPNLRYIWMDDVELKGAGGHSEWRVSPNSVQDALHEKAINRPTLHLRASLYDRHYYAMNVPGVADKFCYDVCCEVRCCEVPLWSFEV